MSILVTLRMIPQKLMYYFQMICLIIVQQIIIAEKGSIQILSKDYVLLWYFYGCVYWMACQGPSMMFIYLQIHKKGKQDILLPDRQKGQLCSTVIMLMSF